MDNKYSLSNVKAKEYLYDIDKAFAFMDRKDINFKSFESSNLGVYLFTKNAENELLYQDTTYEDLLALDDNYYFKQICISEKELPPFFVSIRKCKRGEFRGDGYVSRNAICLEQSVFTSKKVTAEKLPFEWKNGKLECAIKYIQYCKSPEVKKSLNIAKQNLLTSLIFAWEDYFKWKIRCKMPEWDKSIDFYINPSNIKEVFKLRDIKDGEQRRKALKHIVKSHERTLSSGEKIEIMRYLRGKEKFTQNGYEITIIPSKDDVKSIASKL